MNIISGTARNLILSELPDDGIRPTAVRARKALFDSLGDFTGLGVLDLCSGSGALALESASRGAAWCAMVEKDPAHLNCIRENCRRIAMTGITAKLLIMEFDIFNFNRYLQQLPAKPDIIFADPPYNLSAEFFRKLTGSMSFAENFDGAKLIWEIPDTPGAMGGFINGENLKNI
jgi:16S rRNA (guanine966-N2)-methyltransferase